MHKTSAGRHLDQQPFGEEGRSQEDLRPYQGLPRLLNTKKAFNQKASVIHYITGNFNNNIIMS